MPSSQARVDANRRNAQLSTGPTTEAGKARSRANSLKHGLTGEGIVIPTEDVEEIGRLFTALAAEMKPGNELARRLVNRVALLTVRLERSAEHEAKAIAHKMRRAEEKFDDARLAEMEHCYSWIAHEPATNARRLRSSPEGIRRLRDVLGDLRDDLAHPEGVRWDHARCDQLHHVLGLRYGDVPDSRAKVLSQALDGDFRQLRQADGGDLGAHDRKHWALEALIELIEREIAKLDELEADFDHDGLAMDRAEAVHRAIFDASAEAVLARKYEATTERGLFRTLREFREAQEITPQVDPIEDLAREPADEVGSFLPEARAESVDESYADSTDTQAGSDPGVVRPRGEKSARSGKSHKMGKKGRRDSVDSFSRE